MNVIFSALLATLIIIPMRAGNELPGAPQQTTVAIVNATVHTVTNGIIPGATLVFDKGRITSIAVGTIPPKGARVIDASGRHVFPGFITPLSTIGLSEVDAVRATRDMAEVGEFNPNARAETAYNPDSEIIPTIRSNGILIANVAPVSGVISGMSSLMRLDGWTREDISILPRSALVMSWPNMAVSRAPHVRESLEDQKIAITSSIRQIYEQFRSAKAYSLIAAVDSSKRDIRLEELKRVFTERLPVIVYATSQEQIESVLSFGREIDVQLIIAGATDAPLMTEEIRAAGVSLIIQRVHSLPSRAESAYDEAFTLAATLAKAGIPFAFSEGGAWQQRNLPFNAGTAIAYGLSQDDAERALTITPAQMFGVSKDYGSLEVGKSATLFVSKGNALDALTNRVEVAFIDGREVELSNRHTKLTKKYRQRYAK